MKDTLVQQCLDILKREDIKNELKMVQIHQRKNDSALAVAMTELKILTRLGKI